MPEPLKENVLEVGISADKTEVIINHPNIHPDADGVGHITFSPAQARNLARLLDRKADEIEPPPEPGMQAFINSGINGFAFELVSESLAGKKDVRTFNPVRFKHRGVIYTMEPEVHVG